jgi:PAS domain S-box-containing protein
MSTQALPAKAEQLFRYLFEQASLGIAVEDLEGKILLANPSLCSMLGYRNDELPGMSCSQFANPEDSKDDWALFQQLRAGVIDHYAVEKRYVRKDGTPLWGRLNVSLLKEADGESPLVFAFVENITDRKQAEEALHQKEKELTETQRQAGIGSWSWDARTDRMTWSHEISLRAGHDPNSPAPKLKEQAGLFTPESWDQLLRTVQEAVQTGVSYELDLELVSPLSGLRWATTRGEPLRDAQGKIIGLRGTIQDITEHKLAEQELAKTNDRFRLVMEASKSVGWEWDIPSGRDSWFGDLQTMFGIPSDSFDGRVEDFYRRIHPEDQKIVAQAVADAMQNQKPYAAEYRVVRLDGTVRWVAARGSFYYAGTGDPVRMLGMAVDITERKRTEEALRESEQRFRQAIQAGKMYAFDWNVITDEIVRSKESADILNWTDPEHDTGRDFHTRVHPDDKASYSASEARLTPENPVYQICFRTLGSDGSVRWLEDTGRAFFDAQRKMVRVTGMVSDITERKRAEEKLRESEERFRLAAQAGKMYAYEWRPASDMVTRSEEYVNMLGLIDPAEQLTRQQLAARVHPEDRARFIRSIDQLTPENPTNQISYRVLRPDGSVIWLEKSGRAFFDPQGRLLRMMGMVADITQRKATEERLREYEKAFEGSDEMMTVVDREYRYLIANRKFLKMRNLTKEQVVGRLIPEVLNKEVFDKVVKQKLDECFAGKVVKFEMRYTYPDLGERDFFVSYFPIEGATGVDRAVCVLQDMTDWKHVQEALKKSEEKFSKAFQHGPMALTLTSAKDHRYIDVNETFERITGWRRDEVIGRTSFDIELWADPADRVELAKRLLIERSLQNLEFRFRMKDGSIRIGLSSAELIELEGEPCILGVTADITDYKRSQDALRESEDKLRLLLDSTAEAIYGIDLEHRCTFCNPAGFRALGYEHVDQVLGKNMHDLIHHTRPDGSPFPVDECRIHRITLTGEGTHADDELLWRANGTSFPAEYWSHPQRRGQEVVGAVVAFIDITERKLADAALANVSRKLIEAQEQERTRIGRELHDDIGQRLALLAVELQRLQKDPLIFPGVRSRLEGLHKRASEIAADTQSLSHELHSARLQYLGVTAAMRGFCREFGEQQKMKIDFKANDLATPLPADVSLSLFRVLQEALHNSAKHSGVQRFEVRLWGTTNQIRLTVRDSGKGFDREAARTSHGLGLVSMEERLKLVNGTLSIESQPGRGTTIEARVPVSSESDSMRAVG